MFWNNKKEESESVKELKEIVAKREKKIGELYNEHEKEIENINKDHQIVLKRKDAEVDVLVSKETKVLKDNVARLELENGNLKKENEILKKAFENMGFDVKDMKGILNKLVDGIVSKNTVNVLK